jgi:hypothetical protein
VEAVHSLSINVWKRYTTSNKQQKQQNMVDKRDNKCKMDSLRTCQSPPISRVKTIIPEFKARTENCSTKKPSKMVKAQFKDMRVASVCKKQLGCKPL